MALRRRPLGAAWILLALLPVAGCTLTDCPGFDFDAVEDEFVRVEAPAPDAEAVTVVLVKDGEWGQVDYFVRVGAETPAPAGDGRLGVSFGFDGGTFEARPPAFAAVTRGDTVFVFIEGTLASSVFQEACSPPVPYLTVDVLGVEAPEGVTRVAFEVVEARELNEAALTDLRDHEAARAAARTRTA